MGLASKLAAFAARLTSDSKVPQTALAANVAGNGPVVIAGQSTVQTISSSTATKIICDNEQTDTNGCYDPSLGKFQPNVAGYYLVTVRVETSNRGGSETYEFLKKNGTEVARFVDITTTSWWGTSYSVVVYLNGSTDYVDHWLFQSTGSSKTTTIGTGLSYFQAVLLRAA